MNEPQLSEEELQEAREKSSVTVHVVHEAVRREGEEELKRSNSALAWSGFAAGLSIGFSAILEGLLRSSLPEAPWRPLISKLGYSAGFVLVILGRQQLFTENTLTPVLPLFQKKDRATLWNVARLWVLVFLANMLGTLAVAWTIGNTEVLVPGVRDAIAGIGKDAISPGFGLILLRGIFGGWLMALLVWVLPFAETARFFVIVSITWLISLGGFAHVVAGAVEVLFLATTGLTTWQHAVGGFIVPALIGNIIGGVALVAVINHAQVVS